MHTISISTLSNGSQKEGPPFTYCTQKTGILFSIVQPDGMQLYSVEFLFQKVVVRLLEFVFPFENLPSGTYYMTRARKRTPHTRTPHTRTPPHAHAPHTRTPNLTLTLELQHVVLSNLSLRDLIHFAYTCKRWYEIITSDNALWKVIIPSICFFLF